MFDILCRIEVEACFVECKSKTCFFLVGFECYMCDRANEKYQNKKEHSNNPDIPLMPPKLTDGRKFACPQPEPFAKPDKLDW